MKRTERKQLWENRIAKYRASGQSVKAWCADNDVNPNQLWYWLRKHKTDKENTESPQWLPVEINEQPGFLEQNDSIIIQVGKASVVVKPGFNKNLLCDVVSALAKL